MYCIDTLRDQFFLFQNAKKHSISFFFAIKTINYARSFCFSCQSVYAPSLGYVTLSLPITCYCLYTSTGVQTHCIRAHLTSIDYSRRKIPHSDNMFCCKYRYIYYNGKYYCSLPIRLPNLILNPIATSTSS